uniref:Uncharacterized protein n=1 Tax=Glossina brevipalpis TaxID=37001 RepID=A0A1A9WF21_9MUSC
MFYDTLLTIATATATAIIVITTTTTTTMTTTNQQITLYITLYIIIRKFILIFGVGWFHRTVEGCCNSKFDLSQKYYHSIELLTKILTVFAKIGETERKVYNVIGETIRIEEDYTKYVRRTVRENDP